MQDRVAGDTGPGPNGGTLGRGGALTAAGEAIPVQLVALMAATQEGPIGVEAALLAWSPHVAFIHILGCQEKQRSESQGTAQSPYFTCSPGLVGKGAPNPTPPCPGPRSLAQPSLTYTGAVVGPQLEARLTLAAKGAGQIDAAVLAVAVAALVYIWDGGRRRRAEGGSQVGSKPAKTQGLATQSLVCVWGLGQVSQDPCMHLKFYVW